MNREYFLAIDIGASGGRHILGSLACDKMELTEVYRFRNGMDEAPDGELFWDTERLFSEILTGLSKCKELGKIPKSVAIDTWGVDYVLIDDMDKPLGRAVAYRDHRTDGIDTEVYKKISEKELYARTGIQKAMYNTIFQLAALKKYHPELLSKAESLLMLPDYFGFLLTGKKAQEYTQASTTQLLNPIKREWDTELISEKLGFPQKLFGRIAMPGSVLGTLREEIRDKVGFDCTVTLAPSHDTASAVFAVPGEGDICYISSGTWSLMGVELSHPSCTEESMEAGLTNEGGYGGRITYLNNIMGLWMIQSVRNELAKDLDYGTICEMASHETIGSVVDCLDNSFLSPKDMAAAVKDYCKKTGQEVPETLSELAAVIYNSLAKCYADRLSVIEEVTGKRYDCIHIVGGGSNASYLNELTARRTQRQIIAGPTEATAIGNLMTQMITAGVFADEKEAKECVRNSFDVKRYEP